MAWEHHANNAYYYKKVRIGSKVKSIYVGKGELAELIAGIDDAIRRAQKAVRLATRLTKSTKSSGKPDRASR